MATKTQKAQAAQVTDLLRKDHKHVQELFKKFHKAKNAEEKQDIVETALLELEVHAELEEKLIYPAIRAEIEDEELMDEALEEHHIVHGVIRELKKMKPDNERYDAKFIVLGELVKHHVKEEEEEMLPKAEKCDIDWEDLNEQVLERKNQLMDGAGASSDNRKRSLAKKK